MLRPNNEKERELIAEIDSLSDTEQTAAGLATMVESHLYSKHWLDLENIIAKAKNI